MAMAISECISLPVKEDKGGAAWRAVVGHLPKTLAADTWHSDEFRASWRAEAAQQKAVQWGVTDRTACALSMLASPFCSSSLHPMHARVHLLHVRCTIEFNELLFANHIRT